MLFLQQQQSELDELSAAVIYEASVFDFKKEEVNNQCYGQLMPMLIAV